MIHLIYTLNQKRERGIHPKSAIEEWWWRRERGVQNWEGETSKWYKRGDQNMEEGQITGGEEERGVTTSPLCGIQYSGTSKIEDTTCLSIVGRLSSFGGPP